MRVGGVRRELVVEVGELIDALDRLADRRIEEQQDALEHRGRHAERLGRDHDRLAGRVAHDALGEFAARCRARVLEHAGEFGGIVLQRGGFQAADRRRPRPAGGDAQPASAASRLVRIRRRSSGWRRRTIR